ncbi:uncharacterized protein BKCO1_4000054 [Diplodia corticola]|uniref:Uncharacterized protein n=1 Tax=Diplodia corticola TaxID=236234 RepID=A0A1J9RUX5_9PEZI|nr:uncharacterized protein BKCO1_4000054 [Diplodia corticola]OJD32223.1 hypothetical protein BKCO1_4000054 [Diplodia corticola]
MSALAPFRPSLNSPPAHAFGGVPNEIALRIINFIARKRDIANLALTCKDLRLLTLPLLYEHIYITETKWSPQDLCDLTSPSNPASTEIRDITIIRPFPRGQHFYNNWAHLFRHIPNHQLRSVRFICQATPEHPTSFVDYMFQTQRNLVTLDLRWPPRALSTMPSPDRTLPYLPMLTSIAICVQCNSHVSMAKAAGAMLAGACNLKHLSGGCCVHHTAPGRPDSFVLTANMLALLGIRFRLKTLTLTGCPWKRNSSVVFCRLLEEIVDFSDLQSLTLRECMRRPGIFLSMIANLYPDTKVRDIVIEGGYFDDTEIYNFQKFRNLRRLVLAGVGVLHTSGPKAGASYSTRKGFIKMCQELTLRSGTLRTLCLEVCGRGRSRVTLSLGRSFSALGEDMYRVLTNLVASHPGLEELWISLPTLETHHSEPNGGELEMQAFLNAVSIAPRLRLLCNIRPHKNRQNAEASYDTLVDFYEGNPWLPNVAYEMFRRSASANPALRVVAFGYLPVDGVQGRIETVVEELSAKELFLEEDFYYWDMFEQYEFEGQHASPKLITDCIDWMDTSA